MAPALVVVDKNTGKVVVAITMWSPKISGEQLETLWGKMPSSLRMSVTQRMSPLCGPTAAGLPSTEENLASSWKLPWLPSAIPLTSKQMSSPRLETT